MTSTKICDSPYCNNPVGPKTSRSPDEKRCCSRKCQIDFNNWMTNSGRRLARVIIDETAPMEEIVKMIMFIRTEFRTGVTKKQKGQ